MKKIQRWHPDTHPELALDQEWDTEEPEDAREHRAVRAHVKGGPTFTATKDDKDFPAAIFDPAMVAKLHDDALDLNRHKNLVLLPEILKALPAAHKRKVHDDDGNEVGEDFLSRPSFVVDKKGELVATFRGLPAAVEKAAHAIVKARKLVKKAN